MVQDAHQIMQKRESRRQEASALIGRYPQLSQAELARLIDLYRNLSALDTALMLSDQGLVQQIDRFTSENRRAIRRPFRQYAALIVYALLAAVAVGWSMAVAA